MRGGGSERVAPAAPSPAAGSRREPRGARAGPRLSPGLACCSGSDSSSRSILSPCRRTVASWKAAFTALCIPRAGFPGLSSRLRQVSACRLSPPPLTLAGGGLDVARLQQVLRLLDPHRSFASRRAGSWHGGLRACSAFEARSFLAFLMKIPVKLGGLGKKEDLESRWLEQKKMVALPKRSEEC